MRDKDNKRPVKIICGIFVIAMIVGIMYLTFQTPEQTTNLSETVRIWLKNLGWEMTPKEIRSNAHIPLFFFLGFAVFLFGYVIGWKWYLSLFVALGVAFFDEGLKMILPTREFEFFDLIKDYIGIVIAGVLFLAIQKIYQFFSRF